ncbi:hypothetical protein BD779DRAFT_1482742, partial [Infundibulicybe gibba]
MSTAKGRGKKRKLHQAIWFWMLIDYIPGKLYRGPTAVTPIDEDTRAARRQRREVGGEPQLDRKVYGERVSALMKDDTYHFCPRTGSARLCHEAMHETQFVGLELYHSSAIGGHRGPELVGSREFLRSHLRNWLDARQAGKEDRFWAYFMIYGFYAILRSTRDDAEASCSAASQDNHEWEKAMKQELAWERAKPQGPSWHAVMWNRRVPSTDLRFLISNRPVLSASPFIAQSFPRLPTRTAQHPYPPTLYALSTAPAIDRRIRRYPVCLAVGESSRKRPRLHVDIYEDEIPQLPKASIQRHTDIMSTRRGISTRQSFYSMPASPVKHSSAAPEPSLEDDPLDDWNTGADPGEDDGLQLPPDYVDEPHVRELLDEESPRRARSLADSNPLLQWTSDIDNYMAELLRLEGKGEDVYHTTLSCHASLPFHKIKEWNGLYFEKITLKQLGLRYQLGHPIGHACPNPSQARDGDFVLLRARLYPSTTVQPQTAATFRVLESFQLLSFMSKCSAYEFYRTLARRTDNTGTRRYRMIRQWRHLKMLKRSGRGNDPTGSSGTQLGECAVLCPSCPHPNINLPMAGKPLLTPMDANFRLKRLNVSSNDKDPGLNRGFAYFVSEKPFKAFLQTYDKKIPDDVSTCSNHDAIKSASARGGKGVAASGVGAVVCSRHNIQRANGVGDLQKAKARTDGEAPERNWAASNPTSSSTKEMGPGSRRDTLDDHFGDANWKKTTGLVTSYSRKVKEAVAERADHVAAFLDFSASLARETVVEWSEAVRQWESDQTNTNPFEPTLSQITGSKVRLELALEDASDDSPMHIHDDISPSVLISQGLDLEEQQQRLRRDTALMGPHCTDLQRAKMLERSNRLRRRIEAWIEVQHLYMPGVA